MKHPLVLAFLLASLSVTAMAWAKQIVFVGSVDGARIYVDLDTLKEDDDGIRTYDEIQENVGGIYGKDIPDANSAIVEHGIDCKAKKSIQLNLTIYDRQGELLLDADADENETFEPIVDGSILAKEAEYVCE